MKRLIPMISFLAFAAILNLPVAGWAQKEEKDKEAKEKKEMEQIIITLKGDKKEKVMVEINGDKVTINGKPLSEFEEGDITVNRHKIKDRFSFSPPPFSRSWSFSDDPEIEIFSGTAHRAMLGVTTEKSEKGAEIKEITKESAAEKAGLQKGDVITKIEDTKINDPEELAQAIKKQKPGDKVTITFFRDKKEQKVTAELTKWKGLGVYSFTPGQNYKMEMPDLDLKLDDLRGRLKNLPTPEMNGRMGLMLDNRPKLGLSVQDTEEGNGVKVIEVDEESHAEKAGIRENDIITEVNGKAVNSADEMSRMVRENRDKASMMVKLKRDGKIQNIEIKIPKKLKTADL